MAINGTYLKQLMAQHGAQLEIGEPFRIDRTGRWMCICKVVGVPSRFIGLRPLDEQPISYAPEDTQTMCVVSESGATPAEAQKRLLDRIARAKRLPTVPPRARPRRGWLGRMIAAFAAGSASKRDRTG